MQALHLATSGTPVLFFQRSFRPAGPLFNSPPSRGSPRGSPGREPCRWCDTNPGYTKSSWKWSSPSPQTLHGTAIYAYMGLVPGGSVWGGSPMELTTSLMFGYRQPPSLPRHSCNWWTQQNNCIHDAHLLLKSLMFGGFSILLLQAKATATGQAAQV